MELKTQKRIAASVLKTSPKKVVFDTTKLSQVKEALTRADIKDLVNSNVIAKKNVNEASRVRARKIQRQKSKGLRKGVGSRKGTANARLKKKDAWMVAVRTQRELIRELREKSKISVATYRKLYAKVKGNFFRNKRHIKQYLEEHKLFE
jgi:large subunit ribosomal protein L19e